MRFAFIRDHKAAFPVEVLCKVLKVSRGGYYAWSRRPPSPAAVRRVELVAAIRQAHVAGRSTYGSPRVYRALKARGVPCCENTVAKLMRAEGVRPKARRPFAVQTTDSRHDRPIAKNVLNREFYPDRPDAVWTADITYVPTAEGWLYLAVVLDLFSRRVVGWATADHLRSGLTCDALRMALEHRRPGGKLLHHSDRGVQYASQAYQGVLSEHGIEPSMSRAGNCWDNAVAESFFSSFKLDLLYMHSWPNLIAARSAVFEYIELVQP